MNNPNDNLKYILGANKSGRTGAPAGEEEIADTHRQEVRIPEFHHEDRVQGWRAPEGHPPQDIPVPKDSRFPHVTSNSFTFATTVGTNLTGNIPFGRANSVRVDNYTNQWVLVGGKTYGFFIQPYSYGWMFALPLGETTAYLHFDAPQGQTQPPQVNGGYCYTTWYEERFSSEAGVLIFSSASGGGAGVSNTLNTGQVSVAATATQVIAANTNRFTITVKNPVSNTNPFFIGGSSAVTDTTGSELDPGDALTLSNYKGAVWADCASTQTITFIEESA